MTMCDDSSRVASIRGMSGMDKDRDLLPWILGGLSLATVALAVSVASTNRRAPSSPQASSQTTAQALPQAALPAAAPLPVPTAPAPVAEASQTQAVIPPTQSTGQIWECTTNGQKTFSNNPCGDKSSLLDVGPINTMDRTPIYRFAPDYHPGPGYAPEYGDGDSQESADNSYPVMVVGVPVLSHRVPLRAHRPYNHEHSSAPRKY
jgi:hypothetical protein